MSESPPPNPTPTGPPSDRSNPEGATAEPIPRRRLTRWLDRLGPAIGLLAVLLFFGALDPDQFFTLSNLQIILLQTAVVGVAAIGATLVIISAGIDLSVGSMIAVVAVSCAVLSRAGFGPTEAAALAVLIGGVGGLLNGLLIAYGRIAPFIVTLGMLGALRGVAKGLADEQMVYPKDIGWIRGIMRPLPPDQPWMLLPPGVWLMLALGLAFAALLRYGRFGRHTIAVGSNEQTARLCGIRVRRTKIMVYILAGLLAGVAGVLQFGRESVGNPTTAMGYELDVIAAVVIGGASLAGGRGSVFGALVGAMIMRAIANGCVVLGWPNYVQEIATGVIIVAAVALDRFRRRT